MTANLRRQLAAAGGATVPVVVFFRPTARGLHAPKPDELAPLAARLLDRVQRLTHETPEHVEVHSLLGTLALEATGSFVEKLAEQPEVDRLIDDLELEAI